MTLVLIGLSTSGCSVSRGDGFGFFSKSENEVTGAIDKLIATYEKLRQGKESFPETYRRVGQAPFKEALYAAR